MVRFRSPRSIPRPKSLSDWLMKLAWRDSSRAMKRINCLMSGFSTFLKISLYRMQPENSEVSDEIRKSRNSWRMAGLTCENRSATSVANSGVRWKWSWLLSPSYSAIMASHCVRMDEISSRSMALKSVV